MTGPATTRWAIWHPMARLRICTRDVAGHACQYDAEGDCYICGEVDGEAS
jgi:hypothetical protein